MYLGGTASAGTLGMWGILVLGLLMVGGLMILAYSLWLKRRYDRMASSRLRELEPRGRVATPNPDRSIREPEPRRTGTG